MGLTPVRQDRLLAPELGEVAVGLQRRWSGPALQARPQQFHSTLYQRCERGDDEQLQQ